MSTLWMLIPLGEDSFNDMPVYIRQPEVPARVAIRQTLMIQPKQMKHSGMQIMDMDLIFYRKI